MSAFVTGLEVECIDDLANSGRGIWKVTAPFVYQSDVLGKTITIESGPEWQAAPAGSTEFGPGSVGSQAASKTPAAAPSGGGGEFTP